DDRFQRYTPRFYGGRSDDTLTVLILEKLSELELMDSADDLDSWRPEHIEAAIEGISEIHAIWYKRHQQLSNQPWLRTFPTQKRMVQSTDLWLALADHARPIFSPWAGPEFGLIQRGLIDSLDECWSQIESMPRTLIHNDFNPRNMAFRRMD